MFIGYRVIIKCSYVLCFYNNTCLYDSSIGHIPEITRWFSQVGCCSSSLVWWKPRQLIDFFGWVWTCLDTLEPHHKAKDCLVPVSRLVLSACAYVLFACIILLVNWIPVLKSSHAVWRLYQHPHVWPFKSSWFDGVCFFLHHEIMMNYVYITSL